MIAVLGIVIALLATAFLLVCVIRIVQFGIWGELIFMVWIFPFAVLAIGLLWLGIYLAT